MLQYSLSVGNCSSAFCGKLLQCSLCEAVPVLSVGSCSSALKVRSCSSAVSEGSWLIPKMMKLTPCHVILIMTAFREEFSMGKSFKCRISTMKMALLLQRTFKRKTSDVWVEIPMIYLCGLLTSHPCNLNEILVKRS
ncbi:hypothetical protein BsWGS_12942 [Bradybaena similaris]